MKRKRLPYARQTITEADIDTVVSVLRGDWLTQGPEVERFEAALCTATGGRHAVVVSNGTSALHLAGIGLGIGRETVGITSAITFAASANGMAHAGADVHFVDVDPRSGLMDLDALEICIDDLIRQKRRPALIVPVHLAGTAVDMVRVAEIAKRCGAKVLEDAAHAIGATYRAANQVFRIGECAHSDATVFSFHPVKHVTSGEGGAVVTNDDALADTLRLLRTHGITRETRWLERDAEDPFFGPWYYEQVALGFNYRLSDIQAALGRSQLTRLETSVRRRREIARQYDMLLTGKALARVLRPLKPGKGTSSFHLYVVQVHVAGASAIEVAELRRDLFLFLRKKGVFTQVHYVPVPWLPYYARMETKAYPGAEAYYAASLSLPMFPSMIDDDVMYVANALTEWAAERP
ncbi:MAG: UDP-4-amino-4,6-dideoxy-N-acetyl-beta-L-altrosamine transaminase [Deltaproteobacteria bacterium]|nr:UDP-4-amino-4,6-dideoxy-N-acetyl-beta-L-altrosamine transaminase [Deltaproteobacteria bacterium]